MLVHRPIDEFPKTSNATPVWRSVAREAQTILHCAERDPERESALCTLVLALAEYGLGEEVRRAASTALAISNRRDDSATHRLALRVLLECSRGDGAFEMALEMARRLKNAGEREAAHDEIDLLGSVDDERSSRALLERANGEATSDPTQWATSGLAAVEVRHHLAFGSLVDAERTSREILDVTPLNRNLCSIDARLALARVAQLRGDLSSARGQLAADETFECLTEDENVRLSFARASLAQCEGNAYQALTRFREIARHTVDSGRLQFWLPEWLVEGTRCAMEAGDVETARSIASFAAAIHGRTRRSPSFATVALQTRGLVSGDITLLAQAKERASASPRPLVRAYAAFDHARAVLAHEIHGAGVAALEYAWDIFTTIGARGQALSVQRLLSRVGIRRRKWLSAASRPLEGWGALTDTELRVARLIGEGHTNRSAALTLGSATSTVSSHTRSIFGKLGISSRVELARMLIAEA